MSQVTAGDGDAPARHRTLDDLADPVGLASGWSVGSFLMVGPDLPRRPDGAPFQPAVWFDATGRAVALVTDAAGIPLGHEAWEAEPLFSPLPDELAEAARAGLSAQDGDVDGPP